MAESSIEWTGKVWNPATGCNKASAGCKFCYAEIMHARLMHMHPDKYSRPFLDGAFAHEPSLVVPFHWKKGTTIFVNSMSDLFHKNISVEFIAKVYAVMFLTSRHTYQILTKRPERRQEVFLSTEFYRLLHIYINYYYGQFIQHGKEDTYSLAQVESLFPLKNVWEGTSVESQKVADERIPALVQTPATLRWISAEPLLEAVDFSNFGGREATPMLTATLDWIVVGGESGSKKRPFNTDWARQIRDYCVDAKVKFFMKQVDKVQAIPADLMIREFPELNQ